VIPNGIDLESIPIAADRDIEVLVAGLKNPSLAAAITTRLRQVGLNVVLVTAWLPRPKFLELLSRAHVAVMLPRTQEGFYLPALEAMAAEAVVVCPDCVGNRGFCRDGETAFRPAYLLDDIVAAAIAASVQPERARYAMRRAAAVESRQHGLAAERAAFLRILDGM
jgi:glycosyltransferase involved in cell wall biosynthesis